MRKIQEILFNEKAQEAILKGVNKKANVVKSTMGPWGRPVIIGNGDGPPIITADGVTAARYVNLTDPVEKMGAMAVRGAAERTVWKAGDGTTTAITLAQCIINEGILAVQKGANPMAVKRGIDKAVKICVEWLDKMAIPVNGSLETLTNVATISSRNDEEMGRLIGEAFDKIGAHGDVFVKNSPTQETTVETVEGTKVDSGWMDYRFCTNLSKGKVEYEDAFVLVANKVINNLQEFIPVLEHVKNAGKPLLIIADDVQNESIATLISNRVKHGFPVVAVKIPWHGQRKVDAYDDIALMVGASVVGTNKGLKLKNVNLSHLGTAERIIVSQDSTMIVGGGGNKDTVAPHIDRLKNLVAEKEGTERDVAEDRLARIAGAFAEISVGAGSVLELNEKKDRIDDAVRATKCAIEEGVVPGAGTALLKCVQYLTGAFTGFSGDEVIGAKIISEACKVQLTQICLNGSLDPEFINQKIQEVLNAESPSVGYNVLQDKIENVVDAGIIDPVKVVKSALSNAASIASMIIISNCMLVDEPTYE